MNKNEIIREIELTEEKLKALREKLEAPDLPAVGDVLESAISDRLCVVLHEGKYLIIDGIGAVWMGCSTVKELIGNSRYKNLGAFNEVFMRREEVRKRVKQILDTTDDERDTLETCLCREVSFGESGIKRILGQLRKLAD